MTVTTVNPANGATLGTYEGTLPDAADAILQRAYEAAGTWRQTPPTERAAGLRRRARTRRLGLLLRTD
jgi:acyl-CoA reductase-like NAD-dependent aldehyde dehydrogenase